MKKPRGRPSTWASKIAAPPEALEFYRLLAKLQDSTAFSTCHVYSGASTKALPVINWKQTTTGLPFVVASFLGIESDRKLCATSNCMNPFHYSPNKAKANRLITTEAVTPTQLAPSLLEEWRDLVEFYIDTHQVVPELRNYETMRAIIPEDDLSNDQLRQAI